VKTFDVSKINESDIDKVLSIIKSLEIVFHYENRTLKIDDSNTAIVQSILNRFGNSIHDAAEPISRHGLDLTRFVRQKLVVVISMIFVAAVVAIFLIGRISSNSLNPNGQTKRSEIAQTTSDINLKSQWWPNEFKGIPPLCVANFTSSTCNQDFAYAEVPGAKCPALASGCTSIMIYARAQCSNVYVELKLVDPYETNLGFANSVIRNMGSGETAFLTIPWFVNGVASWHFNEVSCT
jgi:hypothetical protein